MYIEFGKYKFRLSFLYEYDEVYNIISCKMNNLSHFTSVKSELKQPNVTICVIEYRNDDGSFKHLVAGYAYRSCLDNHDKKRGRKVAVVKALKIFSEETLVKVKFGDLDAYQLKKLIWEELFKSNCIKKGY